MLVLIISLSMIAVSLVLLGCAGYIKYRIRNKQLVFSSTLRKVELLEEAAAGLFFIGGVVLVTYALLALPIGY